MIIMILLPLLLLAVPVVDAAVPAYFLKGKLLVTSNVIEFNVFFERQQIIMHGRGTTGCDSILKARSLHHLYVLEFRD